jgi:branched-chain amino acid aminotransferase
VSELSAANIFMVKNGELVTPDCASDILEGITRKSIIEIAQSEGIKVTERKVALTELYTANEVFACGTSAGVAPITNIDGRVINDGVHGKLTNLFSDHLQTTQKDKDHHWTISLET